jgi:hypothetical protein
MSSKKGLRSWWLLAGALTFVAADAFAIVGRPLTPVSYAGVARRTVRRSAYVGAATATAVGVGTAAAVGAAATVRALPPGCAPGVVCGGVTYQPVYSGTTVVYAPQ